MKKIAFYKGNRAGTTPLVLFNSVDILSVRFGVDKLLSQSDAPIIEVKRITSSS